MRFIACKITPYDHFHTRWLYNIEQNKCNNGHTIKYAIYSIKIKIDLFDYFKCLSN